MHPVFRLLPLPLSIALSLSAQAAGTDTNNWALCPAEPAVPFFPDAQPITGNTQPANTLPTATESDEISGISGGMQNLQGNVALRRGDQFLGTDNLQFDQATGRYVAEGSVRYQDSSMRVVGARAEGDQNLNTHMLESVKYQLISRRGNGGARRVEMKGAQGALYGSTYTTCAPAGPGWALHSERIDLDTDAGFGTARNATIRVGKVPILWVPYAKFPIDDQRHTGLLYPSIGSSSRNGFDWRQPIYFNLAPNYDLTLIPRYMSKRGVMLNTEFRYLTNTGRGVLQFGYLPNDRLTDRERDEEALLVPDPDNRRADDRGYFRFNGVQNLSSVWRASTNLNWISDPRFLEDFSSSLSGISNYALVSDIGIYGNGRYWAAGLMADHNQLADYTLRETSLPYDRLPRLFARWEEPFKPWVSLGVDAEAVRFQHVDPDELSVINGVPTNRIGGSRLDIKPYVTFPLEGASWFVRPTVAWRYTTYEIDDGYVPTVPDQSPTRSLPITSIDAGLFFDREVSFGDRAYLSTIEPRMYYLNVPYRDQSGIPLYDTQPLTFSYGQLFRDNRFTGADRQADANQLTLAVTTRLIRQADGREKLTASFGQIRYFDDSLVSTLPCATPGSINCPGTIERGKSTWIADATYEISDRWSVNAGYQWDPKLGEKELVNLRTRYLIGDDGIVNFSYRYRRALLEQVDFSFLYPMTPRWSLVGRYYYSILDKQLLESIAGVQWDSCCVSVRLVGRKYLRNRTGEMNTAIQVELELKGLGSAGPDTESRLRRAILGYQREDLYLVPPATARGSTADAPGTATSPP